MTRFARSVDGMPDIGQGQGWTVREWRRAPTRRVRVDQLIAANRSLYLDANRVERYARSWFRGSPPCVIEHRGHFYLADGHHRAAAAIARGDKRITVRVMRSGQ